MKKTLLDYFRLARQRESLASAQTLYERMPTKEKSGTSSHLEDRDGSMYPVCKELQRPESIFKTGPRKRQREQCTAESPQINKQTTCNAKLKRWKRASQDTKSSQTSHLASITKEKASRGFWSERKAELSKKLWWPTGTASHVSELSRSCVVRTPGSSFLTRQLNKTPTRSWLKISLQSSTYSLAGSTEREGTNGLTKAQKQERSQLYKSLDKKQRQAKKEELDNQIIPNVMRCKLVRMFPTPRQHAWLMRWMNDTRTTYNLAMDRVLKRKLHMLDKLDTAALEKELQSTLVAKAGLSQLAPRHH